MALQPQDQRRTERVVVLVKAMPHAGAHGETVCCAGVTDKGEWRRQFPIHFRQLRDSFKRWHVIEYEYRLPTTDQRPESRRVQEHTIRVTGEVTGVERDALLSRILVPSTKVAEARGQSLALIRPVNTRFFIEKKTPEKIAKEREAYRSAASQTSLFEFDTVLAALDPCPYAFKFEYEDEEGIPHTGTCEDWETAAMYWRFSVKYGERGAIEQIEQTFSIDYPGKGMAFAMGTHSRRPIWLLVGVLRFNRSDQQGLAL